MCFLLDSVCPCEIEHIPIYCCGYNTKGTTMLILEMDKQPTQLLFKGPCGPENTGNGNNITNN